MLVIIECFKITSLEKMYLFTIAKIIRVRENLASIQKNFLLKVFFQERLEANKEGQSLPWGRYIWVRNDRNVVQRRA